MLTVEENAFLEAMAAKHLPGRHDQSTHGRRRGSRVTAAVAEAVESAVGTATQVAEPPKPKPRPPRQRRSTAPDKPADRAVATWDELGRPSGHPPVGQVIGHEGGTYEVLPGQPRRYRVLTSDGRDISDRLVGPTSVDARAALWLDADDRNRVESDSRSRWRKTMEAVPGAFHLDTEQVSGFDEATPAVRESIRSALQRWKDDLFDTSKGVEPNVNAALRGRMVPTSKTDADVAALDKAFELSKTSRRITVHRGVGDGSRILPADWKTRDLTGVEWTDKAYTATSANKVFAASYVGEAQDRGFGVNIKLPKGSPAIALPDAVGGLDAEGEIILPRGLTFRVIKDGAPGRPGMRWLDVEIVEQAEEKAFLEAMALKHLPGRHDQSSHGRHSAANRAREAARELDELRESLDAVRAEQSTAARWMSPDEAKAMRAKMLADNPWAPEQQDALNRYTGSDYHQMNGLLRGVQDVIDDLSDGEREEYAGLIRDAASGMRPTTEPVKVKRFVGGFRAFGLDMDKLTRDEAADRMGAMKGTVLQEAGFMSTSLSEGYGAGSWSGRIKLELDVPPGVQGAYLDGDVGFEREQELLLAPGTRFEVTDVVIDPPHNTVKGRVVVS